MRRELVTHGGGVAIRTIGCVIAVTDAAETTPVAAPATLAIWLARYQRRR